jgi:hypothetical protein
MAVRAPGSGTGKPITEPTGAAFLKPDDVRKKSLTAKIVDVSDGTSKYGPGWNVLVESKLGEHIWTVREDSGNHVRLYKRFKQKWVGKKVKLGVKIHLKKEYVAVLD